jgi:hypothetical protein
VKQHDCDKHQHHDDKNQCPDYEEDECHECLRKGKPTRAGCRGCRDI